ncbi:hypothetical protein AZE42_12935 [Rhizopogon vesiculosus]|uniref:Uncharacterized protein n=1 Tax=Rhizopogon vesiculosus TaxID=180088 RepID=A0A1J8PT34_9AGAM|nr:hypothetical protein AZE42_12935 [Rhizopogon vesiculosus]
MALLYLPMVNDSARLSAVPVSPNR